jgi:hypothetical protein
MGRCLRYWCRAVKKAATSGMYSCRVYLYIIIVCCFLPNAGKTEVPIPPDKINLALRKTADRLLRISGDSTSRIPAIEKTNTNVWRIYLHQPFEYDKLPRFLQESFDQYNITSDYNVTIRQCENAIIDLGFQKADLKQDSTVPCMGRAEPEGCHFIEIAFEENAEKRSLFTGSSFLLGMLVVAGAGVFIWKKKKTASETAKDDDSKWLAFGQSRLDLSGQILETGDQRHQLTYRETKLLNLFATHPGQLLERDNILEQVWGDEGVRVGRSIDMFVSRLRKKLSDDPSVNIAAVHGVGYRMEIKL